MDMRSLFNTSFAARPNACLRAALPPWPARLHARPRHRRYVVCVDTSGACFVLALVRIAHDAFNMTQLLAVAHPELMAVEVTWHAKVRRAGGQAEQERRQATS